MRLEGCGGEQEGGGGMQSKGRAVGSSGEVVGEQGAVRYGARGAGGVRWGQEGLWVWVSRRPSRRGNPQTVYTAMKRKSPGTVGGSPCIVYAVHASKQGAHPIAMHHTWCQTS